MAKKEIEYDAPWKRAMEAIIEQGYTYGDSITHDWIINEMGVNNPADQKDFSSYQDAQLKYLSAIERLKRELMVRHKMALRSVRGEGFEIIHPGKQTNWAMREAAKEVAKAIRTANLRISTINTAILSSEERRQNLEAQGKLAFLSGQKKFIQIS